MRHNYTTLDGLRGIAAIAVVAFHLSDKRLAPNGYLAVDLFL
jgi:peptidoglycan/LPS O-acetylase OafA/YrhL